MVSTWRRLDLKASELRKTYPESGAVGDANGEIREDGEEAVCGRVFEGEIMGYLVNGKEEILVGGGTNDVGTQEERNGKDWSVAKA